MVDGLPRSSPRSNGGAFRDGQCERLLLKAMLCMPKGGGCKGKRPRVAQRRNGNVACEGPYAAGGQARSAEGAGRTVAALQLQTTVGYPQYVNLPEGCSHAGAHAPASIIPYLAYHSIISDSKEKSKTVMTCFSCYSSFNLHLQPVSCGHINALEDK